MNKSFSGAAAAIPPGTSKKTLSSSSTPGQPGSFTDPYSTHFNMTNADGYDVTDALLEFKVKLPKIPSDLCTPYGRQTPYRVRIFEYLADNTVKATPTVEVTHNLIGGAEWTRVNVTKMVQKWTTETGANRGIMVHASRDNYETSHLCQPDMVVHRVGGVVGLID